MIDPVTALVASSLQGFELFRREHRLPDDTAQGTDGDLAMLGNDGRDDAFSGELDELSMATAARPLLEPCGFQFALDDAVGKGSKRRHV